MQARILIVAGSDSGGGAGIQGDIKTVSALGGYAATAITALTAQNTLGVFGIHEIPPEFIARQMRLVLEDIGADAVKTGMLHSVEVIAAVAECLPANIPLILDPVMVAKGGAPLLQESALAALKAKLLPLAFLVTPNIPEAELLAGFPIRSVEDMEKAAHTIAALGAQNVLVKGGHLDESGDEITNLLLETADHDSRITRFTLPRIASRHTHGTGCALASAIATSVAQGMALPQAVERAQAYVSAAIARAPGFGTGYGPLGHG